MHNILETEPASSYLCLGKKGAEYCAWTERHLYLYLQKG